ncbi:hemophore [Mycobacterium kubicae]|uniref:hemophore n=1 Tax=Mycobacterium kubicae TaxID=120959 RepID=UPI0007FD502F|nr:hemophore [Mycobacterium kubicae]OBF19349.1 hemophore [Mycobacterium kubicae]
MKPRTLTMRRGLLAAAITALGAALPGAGTAVLAAPAAPGASDPCAASEVARTIGTVAKQAGDYLDSHQETNQVMTNALQQQPGPQSLGSIKNYLDANPKVASDLQGLASPLNKLGTQCKLPISLPQALGMVQAAQNGGGLPNLPALAPGATSPLPGGAPAGTAPLPGVTLPPGQSMPGAAAPVAGAPAATAPIPGAVH